MSAFARKVITTAVAGLTMAFASIALADHHGGSKEMQKDIVDTAVSAGSFNTLAAALDAAGLVETLKGEGPFTVFAPTDEAFGALLEELGITHLADQKASLL